MKTTRIHPIVPVIAISIFLAVLGLVLGPQSAYQIPSLKEAHASFNGTPIDLEISTSTQDQERGLGGRPSVPDGYGMLFVFTQPGKYGIWMKDMQTPIDIFWLSDSLQVIYMKTNVSPSTYPDVFYPTGPALYVLETRAGYAQANNISVGSMLSGLTFPGGVSK